MLDNKCLQLLEDCPYGILVQNLKGQILDCNEGITEILGYSKTELLKMRIKEFFPKKILPKLPKNKSSIEESRLFFLDVVMIRKNKTSLSVEISFKPYTLDGEDVFLLIIRDISHHKFTEQLLVNEKQLFRRYLDVANVILVVLDSVGKVQMINKKGCQILGYSEKYILQKDWFSNFLPKKNRNKVKAVFRQIIKGNLKGVEFHENTILNRKGEERLIVWHNNFMRNEEGVIYGLISSGEDVTESRVIKERFVESELSYRRLFEAAKDGILLLDSTTGMILDVNKYLLDLLGYSKEVFLNKHVWDVGVFKNVVRSKNNFKKLQKAKFIRYENLPLQSKTGKVTPVEFVANEYSVGDRQIIQCNIRNITERRNLELQLIEDRQNLEVAHGIAKIGTYVLDLSTGIWNSSALLDDIFGIDKTYKRSIFGWGKLIHKADRSFMVNYFNNNVLKQHELFDRIYRIERKNDHSVRWVHGLGRLELDKQGKPIKMIGTIQDITDKKIIEDALKESEEKYHTLIEKSNDGIVLIQDGKTKYVNKKLSEMLGFTPEEALERNFIDFVAKNDKKMVDERHKARLEGKKVEERYEFSLVTKDGLTIPVEINVSLVKINNEIGVIAIIRDVAKAKELDRMKNEFISVVSHQMRTPLTGVRWFTELLLANKAGKLNDLQDDYVTQVHDSNLRMIKLVNDLLDVSRLESLEKFKIQRKPIDIVKLFHSIVDSYRPVADKNNIQFFHKGKCVKKLIVKIDKDKVSTVLQNILDNAIKYSSANGVIDISILRNKRNVIFSIKDHGLGIPKEQEYRVFNRFFRADNVISTYSGTGLGLFIAKQITEKHGGKIWFESEQGKGTTFFLSLPIK